MADETPPQKPFIPKNALSGGFGEGFRVGLGAPGNEALAQMLAKVQIPSLKVLADAFPRAPGDRQEEDLQPAAIGGEEKKAKPRSRPKRTSLDRIPGRRPMKEYPLTKSELWTLGGIQAGSAVSFSLAGICFGLWTSVKQQIEFADGAKPQVLGYWEGVGDMAFYGMIGLAIIGVALFVLSGFNVIKIILATKHD